MKRGWDNKCGSSSHIRPIVFWHGRDLDLFAEQGAACTHGSRQGFTHRKLFLANGAVVMRQRRIHLFALAGAIWATCWLTAAPTQAQNNSETAPIRTADEQLVKAFDAGNADAVAGLFLPQGELIDENGTVYQGQAEMKELLSKFFQKFPGATLTLEVESIRSISPVSSEEGTPHTTTNEGVDRAQVRYIAVRTKVGDQWPIASVRDFSDDSATTPHDNLQPLAWLVGDWVTESSDAAVKISYRWSEDKNFLLG